MRLTSMLMPPCTASRCPSSEEPTPKGITGTLQSLASLTASATSCVLSAKTTAEGGGASKEDSSRPCCVRTAIAVEQRSAKRAFKAAISASGTSRSAISGVRWERAAGAFIGGSPEGSTILRTAFEKGPDMGNRLTQIATRTGDDGTTGLGDNTRVPKDHLRVHAMGDVDELNSHIGVLLCEPMPAPVRELLVDVQHQLFNLGGELSMPGYTLLKADALLQLDNALAEHNAALPRLAEFILPAGTRAASQAHVCRTVARRAERAVVALGAEAELNDALRQYLNRLSDLLFVLARVLNRVDGGDDMYWKSERMARAAASEE